MARSQIILIIALAISLGVSLGSSHIDQYFLEVVIGIGINIILAVSLNLINGYTGQFSLGHAGFMAVGGYTAAMITLNVSSPWMFVPSLILGGLFAAATGLIVGIPSLRLKGDYLAIVTLGFGEIIRVSLQNMQFVGGALGLKGIPEYTNFFWTFGLAALCTYMVVCLVKSTYGRGFLAVRDDEIAAESMGINTTKYKVTAFVIGAFWAGIAGGLYAHQKTVLTPEGFNFMRSFEIVVMVILGGMGRTAGVIAAAIILTILPEMLREFADYRMIIYSLLLIILMITRPQGIFSWERKRKPTLSA
ncbi:MAG: branched-chain amino acid ABC transporter permease [Limisphaerales bacterium]